MQPKNFADLITFTRSTAAWRFNSAGLYVSEAINTPRFDYDPVTLKPLGLLMEEARTNLAINSEAFTAGIGATVTADAVTAPSGAVTADLIVETVVAGEHYANDINRSVTAGDIYTWSVFVKDAPSANRNLYLRLASAANVAVTFNPRTKALSNSGASSAGFDELLNGWFRVWLTVTMTSTANLVARVQLHNGTTSTYTGDGTSGLYAWGRQLELGAFPTSYIPTAASQVTRAADVATINTLSPWFNAAAGGTLYAEATNLGVAPLTVIAQLGTTTTDRVLLGVAAPGVSGSGGNTVVGGVTQAALQTALGAINQKVAYAFTLNDFAAAANGNLIGTDSSGLIPTVTAMRLAISGASTTTCYIRRLRYYPQRLTNAQIQALTV